MGRNTMKYYGVCTGEGGTGVGDIMSGSDWRRDGDGLEILSGDDWIEVHEVFTCNNLQTSTDLEVEEDRDNLEREVL